MFCSVITNNSNWDILIRIYLLLKDKMGWRMKTFNIFGVYGKFSFLGETERKTVKKH